jgi:hypothetical protein
MNNMNRNLLRTTFGAMLMLCVNLLLAQTPKIQGQKAHQAQTLAPQPQHAPMKPQQSNLPVQRAVVQTK